VIGKLDLTVAGGNGERAENVLPGGDGGRLMVNPGLPAGVPGVGEDEGGSDGGMVV
jgi:hypothetical protein